MRLIDDLVTSVIETKEPISDILRRCLLVAYKLKNDTLKTWVENELNGYGGADELPDYRKAGGVSKGLFLGGWGSELRDQPLPASVLKPEHRHFAEEIRLRQPIASYEGVDKTSSGRFEWPQDLVTMYQSKFYDGMALNRAWMEIPRSVVVGLVDTVRTRVLTFALQIQDELPADSREAVEQIPPAVVDRIIQVTIYGGHNVLGDVGEFHAPTVVAGDLQSLKAALSALGIASEEFNTLERSLAEDRADSGEKRLGSKTVEWLGKATKRAGDVGMKIGEEAVKRLLLQYLGL